MGSTALMLCVFQSLGSTRVALWSLPRQAVEIGTAPTRVARAASAREGKFAVTATQMLDSMERAPRPTRAEATDAARQPWSNSGCRFAKVQNRRS